MPLRPLSGQVLVYYFVLFASLALAALQNITVDDAAVTGAVVPNYLPNATYWNIGNTCKLCNVHPDPSLAYNGTWHDSTYNVNISLQAIDFTFTGRPLIFQSLVALMSTRYHRKCSLYILHHRKQHSLCHDIYKCSISTGQRRLREHVHTYPRIDHRIRVQRTRLCQRVNGSWRA